MKLYKIFAVWEFLIFLLFVAFILFLVFFYFNNSSLNEKGIRALKNKDFLTAQKYFKKNVESGLLDNDSYLNLALSYDLLKQPLKALEIYKTVSSSNHKNSSVFFSYFNQAELYGRLGNLEKALQNYQFALEFGQKEKEIKTNIELLFKQKDQENRQNSKSKGSDSQNQSDRSNNPLKEKDEKQNQQQNSNGNQFEEDKKGNQQEKSDKDQSDKQQSENENKANGEEQEESSSASQSENIGKNKQKTLTEREQKAILEEVQKQENKVRTRFYQNQRTFGDKTGKDW